MKRRDFLSLLGGVLGLQFAKIEPPVKTWPVQTSMYPPASMAGLPRITITNNDSSAHTFSAYIVRSGQAASLDDAGYVLKDKSVAPSETFACEDLEGHVLRPGDSLYMVASANGVLTAHGSG